MPQSGVVIARPVGRRWQVVVPAGREFSATTLAAVRARASKVLGGVVEVEVRVGGLEDLCADAVETGEQADAAFVTALRLRRRTARLLCDAGLSRADCGYLMGLDRNAIKHLLSVPVDSPWMDTGATPFRGRPGRRDIPPAVGIGGRRIGVAVVSRAGNGWWLHVDPEPVWVWTLERAEIVTRDLTGDPAVDVMVSPILDPAVEEAAGETLRAGVVADDLDVSVEEQRRYLVRRLRALEVGYTDIGELLEISNHRARDLIR